MGKRKKEECYGLSGFCQQYTNACVFEYLYIMIPPSLPLHVLLVELVTISHNNVGVWVCGCVCERKRESVCVRERESVCVCVCLWG